MIQFILGGAEFAQLCSPLVGPYAMEGNRINMEYQIGERQRFRSRGIKHA